MQKHSDRKEPRPAIGMAGTNGTNGQGGQTNGNNAAGGAPGNSLSALGSAASVSQSVVDSYWPKVDPASAAAASAYAAHAASHHDRSGDYLGMTDPRLNPHAAHQVSRITLLLSLG